VTETGTGAVESLLRAASDPKAAVSRLAQPLAALANAGLQRVERLPFNRALTGARRMSWLALSLADFRAVRAATGATLNDLVLAVIGDGVGTFLRLQGQPPTARSLRAMVPVDVRRDDEAGQLGNRVSIVPVEIPFDGAPLERLAAVSARTKQVKHAGVADLVERLASAGGVVPAALYAGVLRLSSRPNVLTWSAAWRNLAPLTANLVCTNVPGPQVPMYAQGHLLVAHYPVVPLAYDFGVSFAVLSYNQRMFVGAIADAAAVDDLEALVSQIEAAFVDLRETVGVQACPPVDVSRRAGRGVPHSDARSNPTPPTVAGPPPARRERPARTQRRKRPAAKKPPGARRPRGGDDEE
jgi:WS/DGAT/MGAT family acyltransferase